MRIRKILGAAVLAGGLLLHGVGAVGAQNLVSDPSFESGTALSTLSSPWLSSGCAGCIWSLTTENIGLGHYPVSGSYYAILSGSSYGTLTQNLTLAQSGDYTFSFWAQKSRANGAWLSFPGSSAITVGGVALTIDTTLATAYAKYTAVVSLTAGLISINFPGNTFDGGPNNILIDDVSLCLILRLGRCDANDLAKTLPAGAPSNANSVANAIDTYSRSVNTLPPGFDLLFDLTGASLSNALQQLAGEAGASGSQQSGTQLTNSFLSLLLNGFFSNRDTFGGFGPAANGYATEKRVTSEAASAYAALDRAAGHRSPSDRHWNIWGSAYGGHALARGGAKGNDTRANGYGFATGLDYRIAADSMVGFALAGGQTSWNIANSLGGGKADVFQSGVYGSRQFGSSYVSAAASYAWFNASTDRTVTVFGTDNLIAGFKAHNIAGRIEAGHRYMTPSLFGITPYAAAQMQAFYLPSYSESAASGSNQFALSYAARTSSTTRGELGVWLDVVRRIGSNDVKLFSRLAWAHDWHSNPTTTASFQTLPGAGFTLNGAASPKDLALVTTGAEFKLTQAVVFSAKLDGEFAAGLQS